jgi:surface polysaccharide O-acyltransferase-like enzyme
MVIFMHSPRASLGMLHSTLMPIVSYVTMPCIGLFFMVSGALLLPVTMDIKSFMKKRLSKVVWPTLFWTAFYIIVGCFTKNISINDLLISIVSIPFCAQGIGILWFMYTLIGLYLLAPIISPWLEKASKKTIETYLLIWLISMCYPYIRIFLNIPNSENNIIYYFSGYAGYYLLGYYMHTYFFNRDTKRHKSSLFKVICVAFIFSVILPGYIMISKYKINPMLVYFSYLSISTAVMCLAWFFICHEFVGETIKYLFLDKLLSDVSSMTFGIYLCHAFIMWHILWEWPFLRVLPLSLEIPFCAVMTFLLSYIVVKCISKLPFSKYIIGY